MTGNPFTLTFGQKPNEFISRPEPINTIRESFDMPDPASRVYMIAGVRGSGKTVSLAELSDHYSANEESEKGCMFRLNISMYTENA